MRVTKEWQTINTKVMDEREHENESQGLGTESQGAPAFTAEEDLPARKATKEQQGDWEGSLASGKPRKESSRTREWLAVSCAQCS